MQATPGRAQSDIEIGQAPGELARLQAFVNTLDIEQGTDELSTPAALDGWLRRQGLGEGPGESPLLAEPPDSARPADLELALALREALRAVLRSHVTHRSARPAGAVLSGDRDTDQAEQLAVIAAGLHATITADASGVIRVLPGEPGSRAALARLLLIAAEAATLGTWGRLKICSADDCQWAFYDRSPTRTGCWCSMQGCGSRAKSRAYRSRQAQAG